MSIIETFKSLAARREALQEEATERVGIELQQFLKDNPEIDKLAWCQYTPYFNDGDECVFSVDELRAHLAWDDEEEEEEDDEEEDEDEDNEDNEDDDDDGDAFYYGDGWFSAGYGEEFESLSAKTQAALTELDELWSEVEDDLYAAFGDHVQVLVTKKGIELFEYEHE